jgi:tripartite-type tricarboxylate transporter receptor subunit TctC
MKPRLVIGLVVLLSGLYFGSVSAALAQESFYKGKSIRLIVGSTPGGFYDRWARFFARYMPKYIPAILRLPCRTCRRPDL